MDRRSLLTGIFAGGAALALPAKVAEQASSLTPGQAAIVDIARREIARAGENVWQRKLGETAEFG